MNDQQQIRADALTEAERLLLARVNDCTKPIDAADRNGILKLIERLAACPSSQPAAAPIEEMIRFCPECGRLGDIPAGYEACCPDWSQARIVPKRFAELCAETFRLCVSQPFPKSSAAPADERDKR